MTEKIVRYGEGDEPEYVINATNRSLQKVKQDRLDRFRYLFHITRNWPFASPQKHYEYVRGLA